MNKKARKIALTILVPLIVVTITYTVIIPKVMETRTAEAVQFLEFNGYTDAEYIESDGFGYKMKFSVTKDNKPTTVHVSVYKNIMTVGP